MHVLRLQVTLPYLGEIKGSTGAFYHRCLSSTMTTPRSGAHRKESRNTNKQRGRLLSIEMSSAGPTMRDLNASGQFAK